MKGTARTADEKANQGEQGTKRKNNNKRTKQNDDNNNDKNNNTNVNQTKSGGDGVEDSKLTRPDPWARELDFSEYFYTPHTIACLCVIVMTLLLLLRYYYFPNLGRVATVKLGLFAAGFTFVGFGAVHLPDGLIVRPHPSLWRAVLALGILYLLFLAFILFQDLETVRAISFYIDPSLAKPLVQSEYATDCRISTPEDPWLFFHTAFDSFVLAHSLGYVLKALIMRDWRLVTCVSIGFELVEITFQHVLPNFRECWWDHILLDVLLCNAGGTIMGMYLLRLLRAKKYHWIALKEIPTMKGKARRLLGQLGPRTFVAYDWNVFASARRFFQAGGICALMLLQELNCFTMKAVLNMHQHNPLVVGRLLLWALLAVPALREFYEFFTNPSVNRVGTTAWVTTLGLTVETIWILKMVLEGGFFTEPMPVHIALPWMVAIPSFLIWILLFFGCLSREERCGRRHRLAYHAVNIFYYVAIAAVAGLFMMGLPDLQIGRAAFEAAVAPYESKIFFWRK